MKYCARCILPDTRPNLVLGPDGVCNACASHATKPAIDWIAREQAFRDVVEHAMSRSRRYDCLIPVSGGKDSTWQVVKCLEYGLTPLAVTWKTPARTAIGQKNLDNLISLGVDHVDYQINPKVEKRFMLRAFEKFGSTAIPMHMALFSIPLTLASRLEIPLVVWGENSAFEYGGVDDERKGFRLDGAWLRTHGVTHGTTARDWLAEGLSEKELSAYFGPTDAELKSKGILAAFLGYYFEWDPQKSLEVASAHGFESDTAGPRTGYYDFADIDDDFISLHHYMKWPKFGLTRLFDNLSLEIRNGRMTRDEAIEIVRKAGDQTPYADVDRFCEFAGISTRRFFEIADSFRNPKIWLKQNGVWTIPNFLILDWNWT
ncbi:MAG: N-acetyl sugar amidotransferase [Planctomycetaceae bacterium]